MRTGSVLRSFIGPCAVILSLFVRNIPAAEISAAEAERAVGTWLRRGSALESRLGGSVQEIATLSAGPGSGAGLHVAKLGNGGFVVVSADDRIGPVLAYSGSGELAADVDSPLWTLLKGDIACRTAAADAAERAAGASRPAGFRAAELDDTEWSAAQAEWMSLLWDGGDGLSPDAAQGVGTIPDIRVAPFVASKWGQATAENSRNGTKCYNYYTPGNYVCGCVATAGAQLMRYHRWPTASVAAGTYSCAVDGAAVSLRTMGGTYDWDAMPSDPRNGVTDAQCRAIGKLTFDLGVSCGTSYTADGGGAPGYMLSKRLPEVFGYSNAVAMEFYPEWGWNYSLETLKSVVVPNCDARLPVVLNIRGADGHTVLVDGYGYAGDDFYVHLNLGGSGTDDAWYNPPNFGTSGNVFDAVDGFVYNIFPTQTAGASVVSGRVLSGETPVEGASVTALRRGASAPAATATTDAKGVYALILPAGTYVVEAVRGASSARKPVELSACVPLAVSDSGLFYSIPEPVCGNLYGQDLELSDLASVADPVFAPGPCVFYPATNVTLSCATEGASVYYTTDGTEPTESGTLYTGAIALSESTTLRARAFKDGMNPSLTVEATYSRSGIGEGVDAPELQWTTDPGHPWTITFSGARNGDDAAVSALYVSGDDRRWTSWMQTDITGPADVSLYYKTVKYHGVFSIDVGGVRALEDGEHTYNQAWTRAEFSVPEGTHTVRIAYQNYVLSGNTYYYGGWSGTGNGAWVDQVAVTYPKTTTDNDCPVPYSWIDRYYPGSCSTPAEYTAKGETDSDGDGFAAWEEYVCGTDPTDGSDYLFCTVGMRDGEPVVDWNRKELPPGRSYRLEGSPTLAPAAWGAVDADSRFFRVVVPYE